MKLISLIGLIAALILSGLLTLVMPIPAAIPAHIWLFSIFGAGTALMVLIEVFILLIAAARK